MTDRLAAWFATVPILVKDGLFAAVLLTGSVLGLTHDSGSKRPTDIGAYALAIVGMSVLTFRRRFPWATMIVSTIAVVAMSSIGYNEAGLPFGTAIAFYSLAAHARRRTRALAFAVLGLAFVILFLNADRSQFRAQDLIPNFVLFVAVWMTGETIRRRSDRLRFAEERAAFLEQDQANEARRAVSSERLRIAQELHDVVAHAMSVIAVQSGMGAHVIDSQPEAAKQALQAIESQSRSALEEMRRMLGVLREEGDIGGSLVPTPVAGDLEALIDNVRRSGVDVALRWETPTPDPPAPESVLLNRYRIVQEALTNVLKHAGPASVLVTISERPGLTTIEVCDDGRGVAQPSSALSLPGSGHGLIGMRERVALFGGTFTAGPRAGGGYSIHATLRWDPSVELPIGPSATGEAEPVSSR